MKSCTNNCLAFSFFLYFMRLTRAWGTVVNLLERLHLTIIRVNCTVNRYFWRNGFEKPDKIIMKQFRYVIQVIIKFSSLVYRKIIARIILRRKVQIFKEKLLYGRMP